MKPTIDVNELNLSKLSKDFSDEDKARELFESLRWPGGKPICPHCKFDESYKIESDKETKHKARRGLYACAACRKTYTATVGTVIEDSHVPLSKWLLATFILCSSKKSVSAAQLSRMLGLTYKTTWFLAHRLRFAMSANHWAVPKLTGTVEVDETFIGGKGDRTTKSARHTPVIALIERNGNARVKVVANVTQKNLGAALNECVSKDAVVNTDEHPGYKAPLKQWKAHHTVNHSKKEYYVQMPSGAVKMTNTAESFFSLLKRGVYGSWHHVSKEHLPKYASEFAWRWNFRHTTDGERMGHAITALDGKRLTYRSVSSVSPT